MSAKRQTAPATEADLERTAELPVLDVAAYEASQVEADVSHTDTWVAPVAATGSADLESELHAVSTSLRELEGRLTRKSERLAAVESEIDGLRAGRAAALAQAATEAEAREATAARLREAIERAERAERSADQKDLATRALEERGAGLAAEAERLRTELRLAQEIVAEKSRQLDVRASDIASRDERIARMEAEAREAAAARASLKSGLDSATARAEALQGELNQTRGEFTAAGRELSTRSDAIADLRNQISLRDRELGGARAEIATLRERLSSYLETLQSHEGRRGVYEDLYSELESAVADREAQTAAERARADRLAGEHEALRRELEERLRAADALRVQLEARGSDFATATQRLAALERQSTDQQDLLRSLREDLSQAQGRTQAVEADLRAAEDTINRLESELRAKGTEIEELKGEREGALKFLDDARIALEQREARIRSLESNAAKSIAALDNIQESMQRLDPLAVTGTEPVLDGAARLLIRKDGDSEVVHVLSRRTTVGRTPENDLQIDTKYISRHHAVILCGPVYTIIEDLNSTNGVLVNNQRVTRQALKDGDAVIIGKSLFRFAVRPVPARN